MLSLWLRPNQPATKHCANAHSLLPTAPAGWGGKHIAKAKRVKTKGREGLFLIMVTGKRQASLGENNISLIETKPPPIYQSNQSRIMEKYNQILKIFSPPFPSPQAQLWLSTSSHSQSTGGKNCGCGQSDTCSTTPSSSREISSQSSTAPTWHPSGKRSQSSMNFCNVSPSQEAAVFHKLLHTNYFSMIHFSRLQSS